MPTPARLTNAAILLGVGYATLVTLFGMSLFEAGAAVLLIVMHAAAERVLFP